MRLEDIKTYGIDPALALLPEKMDTQPARILMIAIALQESRLIYRKQMGGPAHGFYQFERGGGIKGVLEHGATKPHIDSILERFSIVPAESYQAVVYNDVLASAFARLLLWADSRPLPKVDSEPQEYWDCYTSAWRPGKPHRETWDAFHTHAKNFVLGKCD